MTVWMLLVCGCQSAEVPAQDESEALLERGYLVVGIAAQSPINIGKSAVTVAFQIMNGERYEEETLEEVLYIDRSNVEMYGVDGWQ